ncbi:MAG: ABC transporter substrate-binding protein, partial [Oscillospiraceae bacterium]
TVVFTLKEADVTIISALAWNGTFIMPEHIYKDTDWLTNEANNAPIGTGPFKFVEYKNNQTITMEKNADYWGQVPHLDKVILTVNEDINTTFQSFVNGEVDDCDGNVPSNELEALMNDSNYNVYTKMWPNRQYICFNTHEGPFADVKVREAIILGLDRDAIFEKGFKNIGLKAEYYISPLYDWALNKDAKIPDRDLEKANALLDEAGLTKNDKGIRFETTIDTFGGYDEPLKVIQSNFKEMGIELSINTLDDPAYDEKVWFGHKFDLTILGGYQGPDISAMSQRFIKDGGINLGEYNNEKVNELFAKGAITADQNERAKIYKEIQTLLAEDMPVAFLAEKGALIPTKAYVEGHPRADGYKDFCTGYDYSYVWLNK